MTTTTLRTAASQRPPRPAWGPVPAIEIDGLRKSFGDVQWWWLLNTGVWLLIFAGGAALLMSRDTDRV